MYKLFLCLRYLRRRHLAIIGVLAVMLCVAMVLIVVSVMDGFLRKVELAARGLFGDIIVDSSSLSGLARYDAFISTLTGSYRVEGDFEPAEINPPGRAVYRAKAKLADVQALAGRSKFDTPVSYPARADLFKDGRYHSTLEGQLAVEPDRTLRFAADGPADKSLRLGAVYAKVGQGLPEIDSATPVIYSYGLLRIGPDYTTTVQICGIRLPERLAVTDFEQGLFAQTDQADAGFDPPLELLLQRTQEHVELIENAITRENAKPQARQDPDLIRRLGEASRFVEDKIALLDDSLLRRQLAERLQSQLEAEIAKPADRRDAELVKKLTQDIEAQRAVLSERLGQPDARTILGLGIAGLSFRTPEGENIRMITPGHKVVLTLLPAGRGKVPRILDPNTKTFVVVDDVKTDIYQIDSKTVYVPFDELQLLAAMEERLDEKDPSFVDPARCSQIQIKVKSAFDSPARLVDVRSKVRKAWSRFLTEHPDAASSEVVINTWREKLDKFIGPVQKQRTLMTMMFGIISFVAVLLIFSIFYMIVTQKTRDIGVIRAVGGSAAGVAQIFLGYGAATGIVGSALGLIIGCFFVRYINPIEDFIAVYFGYRVWDRDVYLFEKIPNQVDPAVATVIAAWAIASGLIGALIPAVLAATLEPVEALRYE
ncbi:MAG: hypothetical protein AMJ81_03400 [Phycisphaerae bacterium SM23_33]|nr:MAG: hypothetical protein AMJ81_03400 [Phycisphaerae bacterium SM23_33]